MSDRQIILFYRKPHHQQLMGTVKSFPQDSEVVLLAKAHPFLKQENILVFMIIFCCMLSFEAQPLADPAIMASNQFHMDSVDLLTKHLCLRDNLLLNVVL